MKPKVCRFAIALGVAVAALAMPVAAQQYPSQPIKLTIPFSPGGATDVLARVVADELAARLRQPVVPENKPGASTGLAAGQVARAKPDGYTLLFSTATHAINAATNSSLPFDAVSDFDFVGKVGQIGFVIMASPQLKVHDMQGLLGLARSDKVKLQYASSGTNTQGHLWMESLLQQAKVQAVHVPYRGETPAITDLIGGHVHLFLCTLTVCGSRMTDGSMTPLAVTTATRYAPAPNVPTIAEAGFPGNEVTWWSFIAAPKGTPAAIIMKLNTTLNEMLADEKFRKRLAATGIEPGGRTSPVAVRTQVQTEIERWRSSVAKTRPG